ncbi:MAG: hypothetical protein KDI44_05630 [Thiothrix sp.]|nr:hypothetical protein [Thiothrix sp.]HPQ95629.1 hypothetical protein [Thiolinea sp.]
MTSALYRHPSDYAPDLKQEYLHELCNEILDVVKQALMAAGTDHDTAWTRGTLAYGRVQGFFQSLQKSRRKPWITLANKTMDFTFRIGSTCVQFVMDDPFAPRKTHRLKTNALEQLQLEQLQLALGPEPEVAAWRLFVDRDQEEELPGLNAFLVGFDNNLSPVCVWHHDDTAAVPVQTGRRAATVVIPATPVQRRGKAQADRSPKRS